MLKMGTSNGKSNYKKMNDIDLVMGTVTNIMNTFNTLPTCFYGKYTRFGMGISKDGKLQIHIAKAIDPDVKGKPVKGQNRYDTPNQVSFTLDQTECYHLGGSIADVKSGEYEDPGEKNEKYKNVLKFTHYSQDNKPSMFTIAPDKNGKLKVTIRPSDPKLEPLQYVFNQGYNEYSKRTFYEEDIFIDFVKYVAKNSLVELQMFKAKVNILKGVFFDYCMNNNIYIFESNENKSNSNGNNKRNYHNENINEYGDSDDDSGEYQSYGDISDDDDSHSSPYSEDSDEDEEFEKPTPKPQPTPEKKKSKNAFSNLNFG